MRLGAGEDEVAGFVVEIGERQRHELRGGEKQQPERGELPDLRDGAPRELGGTEVGREAKAAIPDFESRLGRAHAPGLRHRVAIVNHVDRHREGQTEAEHGAHQTDPP